MFILQLDHQNYNTTLQGFYKHWNGDKNEEMKEIPQRKL